MASRRQVKCAAGVGGDGGRIGKERAVLIIEFEVPSDDLFCA